MYYKTVTAVILELEGEYFILCRKVVIPYEQPVARWERSHRVQVVTNVSGVGRNGEFVGKRLVFILAGHLGRLQKTYCHRDTEPKRKAGLELGVLY